MTGAASPAARGDAYAPRYARPPRRRGKKGGGYSGGGSKDMSAVSTAATASTSGGNEAYRPHKVPLVTLTEETPTWHECGRHTPGRDDTIASTANNNSNKPNAKVRRNTPNVVRKYRTLGEKIYQHEVALSKQQSTSGGGRDEAWVESTMRRGTLKDRVAAMSVVISQNPVHKLYALDMLLNMVGINVDRFGNATSTAGRPNDRVAQLASEALCDLWKNTLLPPGRKMVGFDGRPLSQYESDTKRTLSPRVLLLWRYEEHLKARYSAYVDLYLSRTLSETSLDANKIVALRTAAGLLRDVPEGEASLLAMIVNKIGDPSRKVASAAGHQLRLVLEDHPAMTHIVAREVQQLAHRPNLSSRALYNCIIFLNQLKLSRDMEEEDDEEEEVGGDGSDNQGDAAKKKQKKKKRPQQQSLPASLINTYFRLFEVAIKKSEVARKKSAKGKSGGGGSSQHDDGTMRGRLLSALLTGVNRAHPYLPRRDAAMEEHVDALYRIAHTSPPAACTQALMLLYHLAVGTPEVGSGSVDGSSSSGSAKKKKKGTAASADAETTRKDRFYRALYSKLSDPTMLSGRQITLFFNLTYKAMKNDTEGTRVVAFAKRLLHTAFHSSPAVVAASLFLVSEVAKYQPDLARSFESALEGSFDPSKREPRAAFTGDQASQPTVACSLWEIALTSHHYHPTVQKFSSSLGEIKYDGDPLRDFALAPFLDKLAYRNPKSRERILKHLKRGESVAERRAGMQSNLGSRSSLPMNDPTLLDEGREVGADEEFFRKFFIERAKRDGIKGITRGKGDRYEGDDGSDAEFEAIDAAEMDGAKKALDEGWNTDSSEEEFAQQLAEKLMENAGNGKANFDAEDPDMEGWSDLEDSSEGGDGGGDIDYSALYGLGGGGSDGSSDDDVRRENDESAEDDSDADAFMDAGMSDSEADEGEEANPSFEREQGNYDDDDDDSGEDGVEAALLEDGDSDEDEDSGDSDDEGKESESRKKKRKGKDRRKKVFEEGFADASEYEHLIAQGWDARKRPRSESRDNGSDDEDDSDNDSGNVSKQLESKSKKRRRRRRREGKS